jgi:exopolysaccharide/PEP-CTERM locus tyrosine autokinase
MEEFRLVKRQLLARYLQDETSLANLVLVTSAVPEEGKTFVAMNLAMSLACERDFRVLLVDADLSRPSVLQKLGIEAKRGLIDMLTDPGLDLGQVLLRTDIPGLTILPPGARHDHSTELLASNVMAQLMEEIAKRYADRLIIIDSPPVLVTTEASALAQHVGQIVFVVRAETTSQVAVREALNLVADCPHIGLLLNAATSGTGVGRFGAYYDKYYGHGDQEGGQRGASQAGQGYQKIKRLIRNTGTRRPGPSAKQPAA